MNKKKLLDFEKKITELYKQARICAPVHLSGNNEEVLIDIFKNISRDDWVFTTYRSHYHALLHGIKPENLEEKILHGHSMHIMNALPRFYSSSIVAGHLPIALGVAVALKRIGSRRKVWAFCGDMASETGVFHEVTKYALNHDLPINFIVEDNGLGVYTPTRDVWQGDGMPWGPSNGSQKNKRVTQYNYKRKGHHHGIGMWVEFSEDKPMASKLRYMDQIKLGMELLGKDDRTIFLGQTVGCKGSPMYETLEAVPLEKRIELPVMEEVQMGISTGMALEGYIPVSIYPRFDFLTLATNQLVNHLDKTKELSQGIFNPKVIVRTMVGDRSPLNPGPQHYQDHTEAYRLMLTNMDVYRLKDPEEIVPVYKNALEEDKSSLVVELAEEYSK